MLSLVSVSLQYQRSEVSHPLGLGATGKAAAIFNQTENEDILTASASGTTEFTVADNGNLTTCW